jgi:hypothetical protein
VWWLKRIPAVNILYDILFCEEPTLPAAKELVNAMGLLSALMLASIVSYPGSIDADEVRAASEKYACWYEGFEYPEQEVMINLRTNSLVAFVCAFCVMTVCIITYIAMIGLDDKTDFHAWYQTGRYVLLFIALLLIKAGFWFCASTYTLFLVKLPVPGDPDSCADLSAHAYLVHGVLVWSVVVTCILVTLALSRAQYHAMIFNEEKNKASEKATRSAMSI